MIIQGLAQIDIKGGVSETNFLYEEMTIKRGINTIMPNEWHSIKVSLNGSTYIVYNMR
jgi:hypothetical protein